MKKFDIKWILILVLVVILAFGLVACGNKGGGDNSQQEEPDDPVVDPNKSSPSEFFGALWESSKSIGATKVDPKTDKIHIGMALDLSLTSDTVAELDVGIEFGLVADLAAMNDSDNPSMGDTALMVKAFDKITKKNWITLWYFLNDEDNIYLQVQDEKFKVNFDAYWNEQFSSLLQGVLEMPIDFLHVDNLLSLINGIAKSGGNDWSLDTLILGNDKGFDGILAAFGLDLKGILGSDSVKGLLSSLGVKLDASGNISIGELLQTLGSVVLESKNCKKYVDGNKTTYVASSLSKTAMTLVDGFTDKLFSEISAVGLSFNVINNKIDDLSISIDGKRSLNKTTIKINITELKIEKTTNSSEALGKTGTFASFAKIDWTGRMNATAWGAKLNIDGEQISIGNVVAQLKASIDLTGAKAENKTAAQLIITNDDKKVLTVEYKDNTLILETDLTNANNANIAKVGLYPLAKLIKEAAVGTDTKAVPVPYKIFGDMADAVISGMFTVTDGKVTAVKSEFTTIAITNVDIAVLAKGAFYAIFSDFATGAGDEKPGKAAELSAYAGDIDNQYKWSLNILNVVKTVLNAIKYDEAKKDYSITLSKLSATLLSLFKDVDKDNKKPANVDEMMALFMCTNDGILLDMTKHGLLPLCQDGVIKDKYISATYSPDQAANEGYDSISGKMISKANAIAIWNYLTDTTANPTLTLSGITVGTYFNPDTVNEPEKNTEAGYVQNSAIAWFVKLVDGSTVTNGSTAKSIVGDLTDTDSAIMIKLNRVTGAMGCDIKLNNLSTVGDITYTISGTNDVYNFTSTTKTAAQANVVVDLDSNFYSLFKAQFGMGANTDVAVGHGINKDIYYLASDATFVPANSADEKGYFTSITYLNAALIRTNDTTGYALVTKAGIIDTNITVDTSTEGVIVIGGTAAGDYAGTYDIEGVAYLVLDKR